jgi:CRP/FNR family cyclic AMP-dependent transcriptional regulator
MTDGRPATTFLDGLTAAEISEIEAIGVHRRFARGAALIFQGEDDDRVMILREGRVKVSRVEDGREFLLWIHDPGEIVGELSFIERGPRTATVTALEPISALVMPASRFRAHLERTPRVEVVLMEAVAARVRLSTARYSETSALDTMGRVAARIVELADRYGAPQGGGVLVDSPLSQEDLGAWVGASRAGVAQAMQRLRGLGWIRTSRMQIEVLDLEALRARGT